ncbi:MAG: hypothetical protein ABIZ72_01080, partial [Candidatus Limnocylindrales bacterium]
MTADPRAFLALDLGAATSSAALIGRLAHRWRLIGALAVPSSSSADGLVEELIRRVAAADPDLAAAIGLSDAVGRVDAARHAVELPRLVARSAPSRTILVTAVSERAAAPLVSAARRSGWRTGSATLDGADPLHLTARLLDRDIDVLLVGAGDPPGADERRQLDELGAIVAGAVARRSDLTVILAGAMADHLERIEASA